MPQWPRLSVSRRSGEACVGERLVIPKAISWRSSVAREFDEFSYQTLDSWSRPRRVIGKAEVSAAGDNPRCVVTSLDPQHSDKEAQEIYEQRYCARGDMENRIKEHQLDLFADRTSCSKLRANQIRLYLASVAYVLMQALRRLGLAGTKMAKAQCSTIRNKLLKIGAHIRSLGFLALSKLPPPARFGHGGK